MLLDSNIVIYAAQPKYAALRSLASQSGAISAINRVEVLGFHRLTPHEEAELDSVFRGLLVLPITASIIESAIEVRRKKKMSVGDAIIAATALEHGLILATNNEIDFNAVPGLRIHNPLKQ